MSNRVVRIILLSSKRRSSGREKYLAWMRRKAFMMFLVGYRYIAMRHQPQAAAADHGEEEPLVDRVIRELNMTIASFL